jgi:aryl-alcohol dehydrogenase-like predicted oxidoreductase
VAAGFARPLDDLTVGALGAGTYLGECDDADDAAYAAGIRHALAGGVNLIDTAINYRCQRSERAVGEALRAAIAAGQARRAEVVVCTKGGYVPLDGTPPPTRAAYRAYLEREFYGPGIMRREDVVGGGHCLAPGFLAHQIARSRANLGLATLDVYYLHNPEQQLEAVDPAALRARLREAFALLEERVAAGEIGRYGCATWDGLRTPPGAPGHLSLAELVDVAREVAGDGHHFRVVQLPINLAMTEAVRQTTQRVPIAQTGTAGRARVERTVSVLQAASELGLSVVASAALMQSQLARNLPEQIRLAFPQLATDAQRAVAFVQAMPGVSAALVGMRRAEHVDENLAASPPA